MRSFIAFFFLLCFTAGKSQIHTTTSVYFSSSNGLADNDVEHLLQDSRGFMWFGTGEGLSRYDGARFKNFFADKNNPSALQGNSISNLQEYKPGHLLFFCDGKLTGLNTFTEQFYQPSLFKNKIIWSIQRAGSNSFFITCSDTCFLIDDELKILEALVPPLKEKKRVVQASVLTDTSWFVGSDLENFFYNPITKKYTPFYFKSNVEPEHQYFHLNYYDAEHGWLYLGNFWDGLHRVDLAGKELYHWKSNLGIGTGGISFIKPKSDSLLWVGTLGSGVYQLNRNTTESKVLFTERSGDVLLKDNRVTDNWTDKDGNEWIATRKGVTKINSSSDNIISWQKDFLYKGTQLTPLSITKAHDHNLYLSAFNGNLFFKIIPSQNKLVSLPAQPIPAIWCMNNWGNELLFSGWGTRVTRFDPLSNKFSNSDLLKKYFPASELVILAFKHSNGDEWYSGNNGGGFVRVAAKDHSIHTYKNDGPHGKFTYGYYANYAEDRKGNLWFGVNKSGKLVQWNIETDHFREIALDTIDGTKGISFSGINELLMDNKDNLWVAFDGSGLVKYNIEKNITTYYSIQNGLPTNYVSSLTFDNKNRLWIGTLKGLSCLIVEKNKFLSFTKEDGLLDDYFSESCSYYDSSANKLWIATSTILMKLDPDILLSKNERTLPVYVDEMLINGKKYTGSQLNNIRFRASQNNLQFSFIAPDMNKGTDIEYSYRLSGINDDWVYNYNSSTASYVRLNPGSYTFSVRAKHKGDNEWILMKAPLSFTIQTPWFKTLWFRLLAITAISFLAWFIIRSYYLRKLEKEKAASEKKQAIEQERTRIATDMHDDFGASLSRIKFISEKMQLSKYSDEHLKHDLTKISTYSDEMAERMNEIVWALNQRYDSLEDLISFSRAYAADYLEHHTIHLLFRADNITNKELKGEIRRNIFMMIKESLHNIVKHASATEVMIEFVQHDQLFVTVKDNGKGFAEENIRPFANGLENMKKRMKDIGGSFTVKNENGTLVQASVRI